MELTGKCAEKFKEWSKGKGTENFNAKVYSLNLAKAMYNATLIHFFDSVGIDIDVYKEDDSNKYAYVVDDKYYVVDSYKDRNEASHHAIKKAN